MGFVAAWRDVLGAVVVVTTVDVEEVLVSTWAAGWVVEPSEDARCGGVEPDDVVSVKTRTSRRSGLDQITQWVLVNERSGLMLVPEG